MATVKDKLHNMNLKAAFVTVVLITFCVVLVLSIGTVVAGNLFRQWLFPQKDQLAVTFNIEYTNGTAHISERRIDIGNAIFSFNQDGNDISEYFGGKLISQGSNNTAPIKNMTITADHIVPSIDSLSPKRKFVYSATAVLMIALPLFYAFSGVLYCAFWFYKRKLALPIKLLNEATEHIKNRDLDFSISYFSNDEMGQLCNSFETMRSALKISNKKQWELIEAQRTLQASVAHDLRNPIAIIQGYVEHLQLQMSNRSLTEEKLSKTLDKLERASKRLEYYTASVKEIVQIEEVEIKPTLLSVPDVIIEMSEDFKVVAEKNNLQLTVKIKGTQKSILLDKSCLYRVLENIFSNAVRFANKVIEFSCNVTNEAIEISVIDDGCGFSEDILKNQKGVLQLEAAGHMGLGLTASHTLCRKNGWTLKLNNSSDTNGAYVKLTIKVE